MKANEFVKQYGWVKSKMYLQRSFDVGVYVEPKLKLMIHQSICDPSHSGLEFCFHRDDLKRLVESHELIGTCGGVESSKAKLSVREKFKPKAQYFAIHPTKPHLIQMYYRNEAKLVPNYRFDLLEQAISDVEACQ